MALTYSLDLPLGSPMPGFALADPDGKMYLSEKILGKMGLLIAFTCNHCPYAMAIWPRLVMLARAAKILGVETVAINPNNHPDYPDDRPERMKEKIRELGIGFPYLVDSTQDVARAFKAQCTPDLYLYNSERRLVYHGRLDDNWQDSTRVSCEELKLAIENLAHGRAISEKQQPSMGCSIKWFGA